MNDYERVANVIRYLDEHRTEQPDLSVLAAQIRLSPSHFHRLFSNWAGITPKDFLQFLTASHVKQALQSGQSVLNAALDAGLSGPGRVHDLCVTLEAASPGEVKSGGAGIQVSAGFTDSPFGTCLIAESSRGICYLAFLDNNDRRRAWNELRCEWPNARLERNDSTATTLAGKIFAQPSGNPHGPLRAFVRGTAFQVRVWRALLQVPPGTLTTYGRLAASIGISAASRAVGAAVGANPIASLIPCHRVIRETGAIGNYRWNPIRKRAMLAWESAQTQAPRHA